MTLGITLDQARAVIAGTLAAGHEKGFNPLTVVVLDAGGHVTAVEREDGSSTTSAIRRNAASTSSALTTPWRSQLATCWLEIRQVARSSISSVPVMSGTLEQPMPSSIQRFT